VYGPRYVELKGKSIIYPNVTIRGDMGSVPIRIGRYVAIGEGTIVRPACYFAGPSSSPSVSTPESEAAAEASSVVKYLPLSIGSHTRIGEDCIIESASIGTSVHVGNNCILSKRCIVKDCCVIDEHTVVPPDMVIPPFSFVSGVPARIHHCTVVPVPVADDNYKDEDDEAQCRPTAGTYKVPESAATEFVEQSQEAFNQFVLDLEKKEART
jgi:dynactin-5